MRTSIAIAVLVGALGASSASAQSSIRAERLLATGEVYRAAGDRGSALAYFRDAIAADPRFGRAYEALAGAYRERGSLTDARAVYFSGVQRAPEHAPLWLGLAEVLDALGATREAADAVRSFVRRAPDDVRGLRLAADLARRRGAWSEALNAYRALLARDDLDAGEREDARRYEAALRLLARPLDPVSAPRVCSGTSAIRRALAQCETR